MLGMFLRDHLPLRKITDDNSSFNQFARDETMTCFMQAVTLFVALLFGNPLVHVRKVNVPARLLVAAVPLGAGFCPAVYCTTDGPSRRRCDRSGPAR